MGDETPTVRNLPLDLENLKDVCDGELALRFRRAVDELSMALGDNDGTYTEKDGIRSGEITIKIKLHTRVQSGSTEVEGNVSFKLPAMRAVGDFGHLRDGVLSFEKTGKQLTLIPQKNGSKPSV